jgi:thioredoxin 1
MKIRDIQAELNSMGISFTDCFDRDSLTRRLLEARNGEIPIRSAEPEAVAREAQPASTQADTSSNPRGDSSTSMFDRETTLKELRSLGVKELRTELANRKIPWRSMLEKEELVQALLSARELAHNFSPSGALSPGQVADINADQLTLELSKPASTPLLLDVYAVWCGPCQMISPQLTAAAQELGCQVRVAKIDSDKFPDWASRLRVGGLPTVIVFDGATGKEIERVEGALMKDGLVQLARKHV